MSEVESLINIPVEHCSNIFGQFDEYVKRLKDIKVTIIARDSQVKILGSESGAGHARKVLANLFGTCQTGKYNNRTKC